MKKKGKQSNPKAKPSEKTKKGSQKKKSAELKALKSAVNQGIINPKTGLVRAIIESPRGSKNKYKYLPELGVFECGPALKGGLSWPFDFGFVPSTLAEDGDPLDIIILMDEAAFPGCLVHCKILGVIQAQQIENGKPIRNDRIIGVHDQSALFGDLGTWKDLPLSFREQTELFFNMYMSAKGKMFELLGWRDSSVAFQVIESAIKGADG